MAITFEAPIPLLRIFDEAKARQFYADYLGFAVDWEHRFGENFPLYMQVSRGGVILHLTEHHGDCCPGSALFFWMSGLDDFHRELTAKNYPYQRPGIEETFYGARCMTLGDPFGNRLKFNERLEPTREQASSRGQ